MATQLKLQQGGNSIEVSEKTFGREFNEALVHQVVTAYMAAGRAGTKRQKSKAEVRGGGIKPWKQKGGGRARAGSIRSPIWVGGGRAFAARPRDFSQKVNRKMYRGAIAALLSELARLERLTVVESFALEAPKTRMLAAKLKELGLTDVLIVVEAYDEKLELASRNLHRRHGPAGHGGRSGEPGPPRARARDGRCRSHARGEAGMSSKERLMQVLVAPHVSEKAARASEQGNQMVFRVARDATKPEIKAAVELMFEVKVDAVQVVNVMGKAKRFGGRPGKRSDWKKAYVKLAQGQTIDFAGAEK